MATLNDMKEHCDNCSSPLEIGQIGKCDDCIEESEPKIYTVKLNVKVYDEQELFKQALKHAIEKDGLTEEAALADLKIDDGIDVHNCLQMVLDPGTSPAGVEILGSEVD